MMDPQEYWLGRSAMDLETAAGTLANVADELKTTTQNVQLGDTDALRQRAIALQGEAMRALFAVMAARCVSERLAVLASLEESKAHG